MEFDPTTVVPAGMSAAKKKAAQKKKAPKKKDAPEKTANSKNPAVVT